MFQNLLRHVCLEYHSSTAGPKDRPDLYSRPYGVGGSGFDYSRIPVSASVDLGLPGPKVLQSGKATLKRDYEGRIAYLLLCVSFSSRGKISIAFPTSSRSWPFWHIRFPSSLGFKPDFNGNWELVLSLDYEYCTSENPPPLFSLSLSLSFLDSSLPLPFKWEGGNQKKNIGPC